MNCLGARQTIENCETHTNYTMKDAFLNADTIALQQWNKVQVHQFAMFNHGLNACDCDHELSALTNCNFIGDANGNIVPAGGSGWAGNRNCPIHPTWQYPDTHYNHHHSYHGVLNIWNSFEWDSVSQRPGGFNQAFVTPPAAIHPIVSKYEHAMDPNRVNDLFTGYPPYVYTTTTGMQNYCMDPQKIRKKPDLEKEITIHPNPATKTITIENVTIGKLITISNSLGQLLLNKKADGPVEELDIKQFPPGIYLISIDGIPAKKFIKT